MSKCIKKSCWFIKNPDRRGYVQVKSPNHPFKNKCNMVCQHRLIKEQYLTRLNGIPTYIHPSLMVHHKDFNIKNNHWSNLQILTKQEHDRIHADLRFKDMSDRICSKCGSNKTYVRKDNGWAIWYNDKNGGWLCKKCSMLDNIRKKRIINNLVKPISGV